MRAPQTPTALAASPTLLLDRAASFFFKPALASTQAGHLPRLSYLPAQCYSTSGALTPSCFAATEGKKIELLVKSNAAQLAKAEAGLGHLLCLQFLFSCQLVLTCLIKDVNILRPILRCLSIECVPFYCDECGPGIQAGAECCWCSSPASDCYG